MWHSISYSYVIAFAVSRISHASDRFVNGQNIFAVVKAVEQNRIYLSHKELLGTWEQNVSQFKAGRDCFGNRTVGLENYGIFVELTPNLAGPCRT